MINLKNINLTSVLSGGADAAACVKGSSEYSCIRGNVQFYQLCGCVLVKAEIEGLPMGEKPCCEPVFAFHIHEGTECSGNTNDPFADAKSHYNPSDCHHPYHAGDMPPLFGMNGSALLIFATDRFKLEEVLGKAVIIHKMSDDFHTQPSGNAGIKIACGIIKKICR